MLSLQERLRLRTSLMSDAASIPPHMQAVEPSVSIRRHAAAWYVLMFLGAELVGLALCLWATTRPWFLYHDSYAALSMMGYGQRANAESCQILIYGDSTALAGINPAILQSNTGLKTCNIAEYRPVVDFMGVNTLLDAYLVHHSAPKYLVTSWDATDFALEHAPMQSFRPEGYLYALQFDRGWWLWSGLIRKPAETFSFLTWAQSALIRDVLRRMTRGNSDWAIDQRSLRDSHAGMSAYRDPPQRSCSQEDDVSPSNHEQNERSVEAFRKRYSVNGTHVIVNVAPVADCHRAAQKDRDLTAGISDNALELLPVSYFNSRDVHLDKVGSDLYSSQLSAQILALMEKDGDEGNRRQPALGAATQ
jgi:hypothetical protein